MRARQRREGLGLPKADQVVVEGLPLHQQQVPVRRLDPPVEPEGDEARGGGDDPAGLGQGGLERLGRPGSDVDQGVLEDHGRDATGGAGRNTRADGPVAPVGTVGAASGGPASDERGG